ncbi:hypothetical protein HPB47_009840 [Ixodes persulcatus]|uniref:Uncharacterized protein n=1 Tax=Ixodes persulcatus TaxID=34615 RepID=A0AC60P137_IXOPE|nr:hypothetical protein HPB47_009840 [Ixodes persulcatus]
MITARCSVNADKCAMLGLTGGGPEHGVRRRTAELRTGLAQGGPARLPRVWRRRRSLADLGFFGGAAPANRLSFGPLPRSAGKPACWERCP